MQQQEQRIRNGDEREMHRDTSNCNEEKDAHSPLGRSTAKPPRTLSTRTSRNDSKKQIQGTALAQLQLSLTTTAGTQNQDEHRAQIRTVQRSKSSPSMETSPPKKDDKLSVKDIVERVAAAGSFVSSQEPNLNNQPKAPIRTKSPTPLVADDGRPPRSPTSPGSGDDSESSGVQQGPRGRRPRRCSMSALHSRTEEQSIITISQVSERHRARRRNSTSSRSEEYLPPVNKNTTVVTRGMTPATRPQRRRSISVSKEQKEGTTVKSIGMDGKVTQTDGACVRRIRNTATKRRPRRNSTGNRIVECIHVNNSTTMDTMGTNKQNSSNPERKESSRRLDQGSLHLSPPKPKASRSLFDRAASIAPEDATNRGKDSSQSVDSPEENGPLERSPSTGLEQKTSPRGRRFSLPRIPKSLSLSLRPTSSCDTGQGKDSTIRTRSRSPSITNPFRKGGDLSSRSSTERTASTVSTEQSNSDWDDSPGSLSPSLRSEEQHGPFGRILSRLKVELHDRSLPIDPNPLSPTSNRNEMPPTVRSGRRPIESNAPSKQTFIASKNPLKHSNGHSKDDQSHLTVEDEVKSEKLMRVCFGAVSIREYARSVSDNPSVGAGTPIGLDWAYNEPTTMPVDFFEESFRKAGPRTRKDFYLTPEQRFHMLLDDWCCTMEEITNAKRSAAHAKYLRQMSLYGSGQSPEALQDLLPFDRKAPSRERASLQNYRLHRNSVAQSALDASTPQKRWIRES